MNAIVGVPPHKAIALLNTEENAQPLPITKTTDTSYYGLYYA